MTALDIRATRGDSERYAVALTEADEALDLTDAMLWMTAKRHQRDADADAIFQKTTDDGITVTDASGGLAQVDLEPEDTASLPAHRTRLYFDIQVRLSSGRIVTPLSGRLTVYPDVTETTA